MIGLAHYNFTNKNISKGNEILKTIRDKILSDNNLLNPYLLEDF